MKGAYCQIFNVPYNVEVTSGSLFSVQNSALDISIQCFAHVRHVDCLHVIPQYCKVHVCSKGLWHCLREKKKEVKSGRADTVCVRVYLHCAHTSAVLTACLH